MSTLRAGATFLILAVVVLLSIFQMQMRGYEKVDRVDSLVLYFNTNSVCHNTEFQDGEVTYIITCSSQYILKSGFSEYTIFEALEEQYVTIDQLTDYILIVVE